MSDHVVVPVDWVKDYAWCCEFIAKTSKLDPTIRNEQAKKARDLLKQPSPEMVPMSDVQELIKALTTISKLPGSWAIADDALAAFNAKFKP